MVNSRENVRQDSKRDHLARCFIGVDVGGTNIKSVVLETVGADAEVLARAECATSSAGPAEILAQVAGIARTHAVAYPRAEGLGFSLPGAVDRVRGEAGVMPNLPGQWHGRPVRDLVSGLARLRTDVVNDARAFTLAEARLGAARGLGAVVGVTLGTGLGGGVVFDGRLYEGASGFAGELGHQVIELGGGPCGCGGRGCAETRVSTHALTSATGLPAVKDVFEAAQAGDQRAREAVHSYIRHLAIALANVHTLLCPDAFVIGGGIAAAGDALFNPLLAAVRKLITFDRPASVHFRRAALGGSAGAIGAALLAADLPTRIVRHDPAF